MALLFSSCLSDREVLPVGDGEKEVEITFKTPGAKMRAAIPEEDDLKDITLLVFEDSSASSKFLFSRYAWRSSSVTNSFKTTLKMGNNLAIYFVANAKDLITDLENTSKLVKETTTWSDAKEFLILDTPSTFDLTTKGLPMWGHKFGVTINDAPNNNIGTVNLLRAVASVDISVTASDFTLEKGHLIFAANKGYLAYDPSLLSANQVTVPQSPTGMTTTIDWSKTVSAADNGTIDNYFYMYDNATPLVWTGINRPTRVILEGKWTGAGGSGNTTFYPLSFRDYNSATQKFEKKQVTRNNKYLITVTEVNGDGWNSIDDAKDADDVNMEYEVVMWNENEDGTIEIDGTNYFYRAASSVVLGYKVHSTEYPNTKEIVIRTNYALSDVKMTFTPGGTGVAGSVSNGRFKAELLEVDTDGTPSSGDEYRCFRFTGLKDYAVDTENPSVLYVTAGRIAFTITVAQNFRSSEPWEDGGGTNTDL